MANSVVMGSSVREKMMHYPVMTERQVAVRWTTSLKTLRRWRLDNEGPVWHKLFHHVRYHEEDILEFERQSAQYWMAILGDGERVPRAVTHPPKNADDRQSPEAPRAGGAVRQREGCCRGYRPVYECQRGDLCNKAGGQV